ncbi:MAG: hypothetical protein JWO09_2277 [Bacteroidetes bacterium]|nr:hypothetical protein [Bacteroidota bacterium]
MKKLIIIAAAFLSYTGAVNAQDTHDTDNREKFQFGLKAGLNYSNVYDEKGEEFKASPKFGLAAGAFMEIPFGKYLGIAPGVQISQKGFRATGMMLGSTYTFTRTTTYLDVPLEFQLKPSEFITLALGGQYSYLLNKRDVFSNSSTSYVQEQQFQNDNVRKNVFGFGGGLDINLRHIVLGARVGCDVQNNNGDGSSTTPRYKNAWFQGTLGYKFYKQGN